MITTKNILNHEFIGQTVRVAYAMNADLVGIQGQVVDETKNLFVIDTVNGEKKVLKGQASFQTNVEEKEIIIDGKALIGRAEARLKK
jgi:ribonuclease P protein subunit POP4